MDDGNQADELQMGGNTDRDSVPIRPPGSMDRQPNQVDDAPAEENGELQRRLHPGGDSSQPSDQQILVSQVRAILQEIHYHPPLPTPDVDSAVNLRTNAPELYKAYVRSINKSIDAEYAERTAPYLFPTRNVRVGQICGLIVALTVLGLSGYALYLGHPWFAGILTALNVVALVAVFTNSGNQD